MIFLWFWSMSCSLVFRTRSGLFRSESPGLKWSARGLSKNWWSKMVKIVREKFLSGWTIWAHPQFSTAEARIYDLFDFLFKIEPEDLYRLLLPLLAGCRLYLTIIQGCINFPTTWYSSPPSLFLNFDFLPQFFRPIPLLKFFHANNLNILGKKICFLFPFFPCYILPHSHDTPFPASQLDIL